MGKVEMHTWYRQYQKLKAQYPDTILLYRLGEFYETFDDDAKLVAELMDTTLTRKEHAVAKSTKEKQYCPMAGIPFHAAENYVARLVSQGYRVAIAEQMSETSSSKSDTRPRSVFASGLEQTSKQRGLVHREVVRVITPGTVLDPSMLPTSKNNYLAAVIAEGDRIGLSYTDLSTGEFAATEFSGERAITRLEGELARLHVSEVLVHEHTSQQVPGLAPVRASLSQDLAPMTKQEREHLLPHERVARRLEQENAARWTQGNVTPLAAWQWEHATACDTLMQQLGVQSLAGFGLDQKPLATRAAGAVLHYIQETQRNSAAQITTLRVYTTGSFMFLDPQTRRNLELLESSEGKSKGSLIGVLDHTRTPMGARLLRRWLSQPLLDHAALARRQEAVACAVDDGLMRAELRQALGQVGDMERSVNRVIQGTAVATPRDLVYLRQALRALPQIIATVADRQPLVHIGYQDWENDAPATDRRSPTSSQRDRQQQQPAVQQTVSEPLRPRKRSKKQESASKKTEPAPRVDGDDLFADDDEPVAPPDNAAGMEAQPQDEEPATTLLAEEPEENPQEKAATIAAAIRETAPSFAPSAPGAQKLDPCSEVLQLLEEALDDDPPALLGSSQYLRNEENGEKPRRVIRPGYDQRIDQVVSASRDAQHYINTLENRERERTGIKSLKVDYNKVFGYFIEVSRNYSNQVPDHYERKQTLVNTERYITIELKEYESVILNAQQRLVEYEREAFTALCRDIVGYAERLRITAQALARLDVVASLAEAAVRGRYTRPLIKDDTTLRISGGRHPVVEQALDEAFVPNDAFVDTDEQQIIVITGPNMAGKSTVLRQVALIVLLAQIGSFVPAEMAEVGLVDRIFSRIGAQDDIATGRSTFMVEMTETAALLTQSTSRSLIILDEVGRGTSTYDGMAIARAVIEYIHNDPRLGCRTLFATHYHELTDLQDILPRVKNYHMAAIEQEGHVVFLYEMRKGGADRSYGIHVAELAGIPRPVIRRASELLAEMENRSGLQSQDTQPQQEPQQSEDHAAASSGVQLSLFDAAPNPVVEYIKRLNINELSPIEALTKLYELQQIAQKPLTLEETV